MKYFFINMDNFEIFFVMFPSLPKFCLIYKKSILLSQMKELAALALKVAKATE